MHAYLVAGGKEKRDLEVGRLLEAYRITPISLTTLTPPHTISSIKELKQRLNIKSTGGNRAVLIEEAHELNIPSQNAFLKTLEEPPEDTIIILSSRSEDSLLPTIRSRCISLIAPISQSSPTPELLIEQEKLFEKLSGAGIGEKIIFAEETGKTREDAIALVEGQLAFLHSLAPNYPDLPYLPNLLKSLLQALWDLRANVNPKMTLFELLKNY